MKDNTIILIIIAIVLVAVFILPRLGLFAVTGEETMTRTAPSIVNPGSTFTITYTAIGVSGSWGASIVDSVTGGCQFPAGTELTTVMLSDEGTTKQVTVTAPSSGSCIFTGDYKYGDFPTKTFTDLTIQICQPQCTRPTDLCQLTSSDGCGGICTWTANQNTNADVNCDNIVDRDELGTYIIKWINNEVSRTELGQVIQAWAS